MLAVALPERLAIATYSEEQAESAKIIPTALVKLLNFPKVIVHYVTQNRHRRKCSEMALRPPYLPVDLRLISHLP